MKRFQDKVAVLTGATGGIGQAVARRLALEGAQLVLTGRSRERGSALAAEIDESALFIATDLTASGAAEGLIGAACERTGRVDVLINNAAMDHTGELVAAAPAEVRDLFELNFVAALRLLQATVPVMGSGGSIVNVGSRLAEVGVAGMGIYGATKGALAALTRSAAIELAPRGIRVNIVAPGMTRTPLYEEWVRSHDDAEGVAEATVSDIPLGRLAEPGDVAAAIAFLASEDAAHVTGVSLPVDGGYTAA